MDNFYTSEKDAQAAVDATYQQLNSLYNRLMYMMAELPTDMMKNGLGMPNANLQDLEFLRFNSQNTFVKDMWKKFVIPVFLGQIRRLLRFQRSK